MDIAKKYFRISEEEAKERLDHEAARSVLLHQHGTSRLKMYAPRGVDGQTPHEQDEVYLVASGRGEFIVESERMPFAPGDLIFVPAGVPHHFENFGDDFYVWVVFFNRAFG